MNVDQANRALLAGAVDDPAVLPRLHALAQAPAVFRFEFGLEKLPEEPGVLSIRGARQYGKSTWLESAVRSTVETFGPGSALMLDGDDIRDDEHLSHELRKLSALFRPEAAVKRLFIDEITAIRNWQRGLKRVLDRGELRDVLVVTTGSHAADLRHGAERLPGRKGRLARTEYIFLPVSYPEFLRAGCDRPENATLAAYLLSGGSPLACGELIRAGRLPEWVIEVVRDWLLGECARAGRPRRSLVAIMEQLHKHGGSQIGQTGLARDAGLANNTVAAGWIEFLGDLLCVGVSPASQAARTGPVEIARKPAKLPFVNLLAAAVWAPEAPRSPSELDALPPARQGVWHEWAVAQELFRRAALRGDPTPERLPFWQGGGHEIDFIRHDGSFVEVKRGAASPLDFSWFARTFPGRRLTVVCLTPFEAQSVRGVTLSSFLRASAGV